MGREEEEYWNDLAGEGWVRRQSTVDGMFEEITSSVIEAARFQSGEWVLDLGCGCGATSLEIARRVGPEGRVTGLDLSRPMLERARERANEAGLNNLHFEALDVQRGDLGQGVDAAFSRFGVMFYDDPIAAFRNIWSALCPGGRLVFACWRAIEHNPYLAGTIGQFARLLGVEPAPPGAPGPFSLADADHTRGLLQKAGFDSVRLEPREFLIHLPSAREAMRVQYDLSARLRPQLDALDAEGRRELEQRVVEALAPYEGSEGLAAPASIWWVSAETPRQAA